MRNYTDAWQLNYKKWAIVTSSAHSLINTFKVLKESWGNSESFRFFDQTQIDEAYHFMQREEMKQLHKEFIALNQKI